MKTHIIILSETIFGSLGENFHSEEYNIGNGDDNEIPFPDIKLLIEGKSKKELVEFLSINGFVKRQWEVGGMASTVELILSRMAILVYAFFDKSGLPTGNIIFTADIGD